MLPVTNMIKRMQELLNIVKFFHHIMVNPIKGTQEGKKLAGVPPGPVAAEEETPEPLSCRDQV